jgi:hypothetical protein
MKSLLVVFVALGVLGLFPGSAAACQTDFENQTVVPHGDLLITFATNKSVYDVGEPVDFFLCIENMGTVPFSFHTWAIPQDGYWVLSDTCTTWTSDYCWNLGPHFYPDAFFFMEWTLVIPAGGSRTWTHTWNGLNRSGSLPLAGTYPVFGGLRDDRTSGDEMFIPPGGARLTITLNSAVPVSKTTWTRLKAFYVD